MAWIPTKKDLPPPFYDALEEYFMNEQERDELLIRLDERTCNIYKLTEQQEEHLKKLNNSVAENTKGVISNKSTIAMLKWIITGAFTIIGGAIAIVLKVLGVY